MSLPDITVHYGDFPGLSTTLLRVVQTVSSRSACLGSACLGSACLGTVCFGTACLVRLKGTVAAAADVAVATAAVTAVSAAAVVATAAVVSATVAAAAALNAERSWWSTVCSGPMARWRRCYRSSPHPLQAALTKTDGISRLQTHGSIKTGLTLSSLPPSVCTRHSQNKGVLIPSSPSPPIHKPVLPNPLITN